MSTHDGCEMRHFAVRDAGQLFGVTLRDQPAEAADAPPLIRQGVGV
jgi:hypothetical protein